MAELTNSRHKKIIRIFVAMSIFGLVVILLYFIWNIGRVTTDDAYIEGRIHSIAPKISGAIKGVHVEDNQGVKKGDLLVEIDPLDYQVKANESEAALEAEKARLLDAEAGIKSAAANLEMQEASLRQAVLDKERAETLYQDKVIPKEKHEKILTAYDLAVAAAKAAKEGLEKSRSLKTLEESLIKQREAAFEAARLNLSYTKILAPCDGYVTKKSVETGNQVQASQPLMAVVALDDIWVVANFKETQLKNVRAGQKVLVKVDTYPGKIFSAKVDSIMAGTGAVFSLFPPENALGNYVKVVQRVPVKIIFDQAADTRHVLRIGMSCIPTIIARNE